MKQITIDCTGITDKDELHKLFAKHLDFPDWYGGTLDSLYDCLTGLDEAVHLTLRNFHGPNGFREALLDAADTDLGFSIAFE